MRNVNGQTEVMARVRRAKWAQGTTQYDPPETDNMQGTTTPAIAVRPDVQRICERIDRGIENLVEAIEAGHSRWIAGELNQAEKYALEKSAALVAAKLGKPSRG